MKCVRPQHGVCEIRGFEYCPCAATATKDLLQFKVPLSSLQGHRENMLRHWLCVTSEYGTGNNKWRETCEDYRNVSLCERKCLSLWIGPHMESIFVSSNGYFCAKRYLSEINFFRGHTGQWIKHFSLPYISVRSKTKHTNTHSPQHTHYQKLICIHMQICMHTLHSHTCTHHTTGCQDCWPTVWGIIMQCVKTNWKSVSALPWAKKKC